VASSGIGVGTARRLAADGAAVALVGGRPSFVDLWPDLRAVSAEIRPDWDLSTPGLREAWDAGDLSQLHGCDMRASRERRR
jgi:NAD(P)-dependent dehydrogenase (short-subunit alcohol dehydrogenase family)